VYDAIFTEENNTPAVIICNENFATDAESASSGRGMPGIRIVPETVQCECTIIEEIEAGVTAVVDDIIAALTKPLTAEEKAPKKKAVEKPSRIIFNGNLEEVNRFFYKRGWTDGLPILPPTEEAVAEMLTGTDLPADHIVAKIIPRLGKATVEKIAINAAMAGALPTYMPVLIAGVKAIMDPKAYFGSFEVSTGSWIPFWIINGPVRNDLNVNGGSGALSPGDIANSTIGRAMGLIIKNIGGARKGIEDMGTLGNSGKYTMVVAENEEESPWEPLHVEHGFNKEDSTVTVSFPNSVLQIWPYGSDDKGILRGVISNVMPGRRGLSLMLIPPHARTLASHGWTKKEIAAFISEYARVPAYRHPEYWGSWLPEKERPPINPEDPVSILRNPDWIRVFVAGGPGNFIGLIMGGISWVTKKAELPRNWAELVKKWKDIVPKYVKY
jgi:hypothetical protein